MASNASFITEMSLYGAGLIGLFVGTYMLANQKPLYSKVSTRKTRKSRSSSS